MESMAEALPRPMTFAQRLIGMFTSPVKVFESLRANPAVLGMLAFFTLSSMVAYLPIHSIIQRESINQMVEQIEGNDNIPAEKKEEIIDQQKSFMEGPFFMVSALVGSLIMIPIMLVLWGFLTWALYGFGSGGDINFKQALSAVSHVSVIFVAASLIKIPMILMKGSPHVATSLALLSPDPNPRSVIYNFLDSFDIFSILALAILANGMAKLARISTGKSWTMAIVLFVIGLGLRVAGAMVGEMFAQMGGG
jgi:hypothetical protein